MWERRRVGVTIVAAKQLALHGEDGVEDLLLLAGHGDWGGAGSEAWAGGVEWSGVEWSVGGGEESVRRSGICRGQRRRRRVGCRTKDAGSRKHKAGTRAVSELARGG